MKYLHSYKDATKASKFGINLTLYDEHVSSNNIVLVEIEVGHLEELYNEVSTFMYVVLDGEVTFVLNDEKVRAELNDMVVVPPKTRIHYFGKAKLLLSVTPAWDEKNEHHVRFVEASESPYAKDKK